jgi:hypothetical protein
MKSIDKSHTYCKIDSYNIFTRNIDAQKKIWDCQNISKEIRSIQNE